MIENKDEYSFLESFSEDEKGILLDVRTQQEIDAGFIKGTIFYDFFDPGFKEKINSLDKSKNYYVYCRSGNRSGQTCELMHEMGFEGNLLNLEGGILGYTGDLEL